MIAGDLVTGRVADHPAGFRFYVYAYFDPRKSVDVPVYIGKGASGNGRHGSVSRALRHWRVKSHNPILQNTINVLRRLDMEPVIRIVGWFSSEDAAFDCERDLISEFGRLSSGGSLFNLTDGGDGATGHIKSAEAIAKIRVALTGRKFSAERRRRISEALCGRTFSVELRAKWSTQRKGRQLSEECKEKLRKKALQRGSSYVTEELREKLRCAAIGVPKRPETIEKLRLAMIGNQHSCGQIQSAETREKRRRALLGQKRTPEARERIRLAAIKRWRQNTLALSDFS